MHGFILAETEGGAEEGETESRKPSDANSDTGIVVARREPLACNAPGTNCTVQRLIEGIERANTFWRAQVNGHEYQ